ncbi:mRNA export factor Gle1 [Episyrphus balteatus]|uniref:mRNA export factor Gle1 n=1 Tax=Episyrphus balteatus TaxID=286459 RepID=UPI00248508DC|nr:mRNA export factor Gle1 [Episyrphus balteatus]
MNSNRLVDGLVSEISALHIKVLQHAAEISPFVTERTIGPDKKEHQEEPVTPIRSERLSQESKEIPKKTKSPLIISPSRRNTSFENLDYETINATIILREAEKNRRKSIRKQIEEIHRKNKPNESKIIEIREKLDEEREKRLQEQLENEKQILEEAKRQALQQLSEEEREINALRQQSQHTLQMITIQAIVQYQKKFRFGYEKVAKVLMSLDKKVLNSAEAHNQKLKTFVQSFDQLIGKIRSQSCGTAELKIAENLCKSIVELEVIIANEAKQQQGQLQRQQQEQQQEQAKQLELQKQQQQQQAQVLQQQQNEQHQKAAAEAAAAVALASNQAKSVEVKAPTDATDSNTNVQVQPIADPNSNVPIEASSQFVSKERFEFYTQINKFYQEKVEKVKPLQSDDNMKKYRFACQKAINIPVNAISAVSSQHLQDKFEKLYSFMNGNPVKTTDGQISINDHPLGRDFCILLMAKKFVSQGDTAVSSNPQAAFPVATVIVSLWKLFPDFGNLFLAYTFKESPFLVPYFIPQKRGQSIEEYSKLLGYRIVDGAIESQEMFLKRQLGIARLYSAVMMTPGRRADGNQHPYGIEHAWIWLSNFIALHPLPDICATLMLEFLTNAGADMLATFGKQFRKLLLVIQQQYFPKLSAVDEGGPKARLEIILGKILMEGQIPKPQGIIPPNFW